MTKNLRTEAGRRQHHGLGTRSQRDMTGKHRGCITGPAPAVSAEVESPNRRKKHVGSDPYNSIKIPGRRAAPRQVRRTLDDMRRLNEEMKSAKRQLATLGADLDAILAVRAKAYGYAQKWATKSLAYRTSGKTIKANVAEARVRGWLTKIMKLEARAAIGKRRRLKSQLAR